MIKSEFIPRIDKINYSICHIDEKFDVNIYLRYPYRYICNEGNKEILYCHPGENKNIWKFITNSKIAAMTINNLLVLVYNEKSLNLL